MTIVCVEKKNFFRILFPLNILFAYFLIIDSITINKMNSSGYLLNSSGYLLSIAFIKKFQNLFP